LKKIVIQFSFYIANGYVVTFLLTCSTQTAEAILHCMENNAESNYEEWLECTLRLLFSQRRAALLCLITCIAAPNTPLNHQRHTD